MEEKTPQTPSPSQGRPPARQSPSVRAAARQATPAFQNRLAELLALQQIDPPIKNPETTRGTLSIRFPINKTGQPHSFTPYNHQLLNTGALPTRSTAWYTYSDLIARGYTEVVPEGNAVGYMRAPVAITTTTSSSSPSPPPSTEETTTSSSSPPPSTEDDDLREVIQQLLRENEELQQAVNRLCLRYQCEENPFSPFVPEELELTLADVYDDPAFGDYGSYTPAPHVARPGADTTTNNNHD